MIKQLALFVTLGFATGVSVLGQSSTLTDTFDGAGFSVPWTGTNNVQGTATLSLQSALSDGTYSWTGLVNSGATLSINLGTGLNFTQADLTSNTETNNLSVIIYSGYFAFAGPPTGYSGGSADFLNGQNGFVAFSPENFAYLGEYNYAYYENTTGPSLNGVMAGQYAPQTATPEPSTIALAGLGMAGLIAARRRK